MTSFLHRFLFDFYSELRPLEPQESSPRCSESTIYQKIAFLNVYRFFFDFGANMPPFSLQKSTNILPKIDPKMHHFFDRFLHRFFFDFGSIFEANLEPCWPLFRLKHGKSERAEGGFCWVYVIFRFWGRPGPLLAPLGLDFFGGWGSILEASGAHVLFFIVFGELKFSDT